jgi:hypothetical protein
MKYVKRFGCMPIARLAWHQASKAGMIEEEGTDSTAPSSINQPGEDDDNDDD